MSDAQARLLLVGIVAAGVALAAVTIVVLSRTVFKDEPPDAAPVGAPS